MQHTIKRHSPIPIVNTMEKADSKMRKDTIHLDRQSLRADMVHGQQAKFARHCSGSYAIHRADLQTKALQDHQPASRAPKVAGKIGGFFGVLN